MTEPAWLSWRTALEIHNLFLARHGGMPGVRDQGVLEASAGRARFKWAYESVGIAQCAASYAYAFATAHAFNDGNKRTAFYSALAFLVLNERTLADVDAEEARDLILDTAMGRTGEDELAHWYARHVVRLPK